MKPLTLYPHEIRRLIDTGTVTVWRPILPQPPASCWYEMNGAGTAACCVFDAPELPGGIGFCPPRIDSADHRLFAPHPPGSERWVRETWLLLESNHWLYPGKSKDFMVDGLINAIEYKARCNSDTDEYRLEYVKAGYPYHWRSPVTMPRWASRLSVVSKAAQARQVQSITEDEAAATGVGPGYVPCPHPELPDIRTTQCVGYRPMFVRRWNERYGKPCKTCRGDGAVTAWSGSASGNDVQLDTEVCPDCNGEPMPLEFVANPWAWATTLTRKDKG